MAPDGPVSDGAGADATENPTPEPPSGPTSPPVTTSSVIKQLDAGREYACVILADDTAKCWGYGSGTPRAKTNLGKVRQIGVGELTTCAILMNGRATCWGQVPANLAGPIKDIDGGYGFACAINADDSVKCWGSDRYGMLGNGGGNGNVVGLKAKRIAVGKHHACAMTLDDRAVCWGHNEFGDCGDGTFTNRSTPVAVKNLGTIKQIGASKYASCAMTSEGTVKCWSAINKPHLSLATDVQIAPPAHLSTGRMFGCAVTASNDVKCWGSNQFGELGNGGPTDTGLNVVDASVLNGEKVKTVAAGYNFTCAVMMDDSVKCWGKGASGELGNGSLQNSRTPVKVKL